jgi:aminoglycoside phosphotransferase (APT) family kinase protein
VAAAKMHVDEVDTDAELVRRLLASQFPDWAGLPIERVASDGTDNAIYRLGGEMAVRLPRIDWAAEQPDRECEWLPRLAPLLPLAVPVPLAAGEPGEGYPWSWSVVPWLAGENAIPERLDDPLTAATALGEFVAALQRIDAAGGPPPGIPNSARGVPLAERDAAVRRGIGELGDNIDGAAVTAAWESALEAPVWGGAPVWLHGDLQAGNLLARDGRLSAVIDFGCLGVGDPACDVMPAWAYFSSETRDAFRAPLAVDDATWARGRGWALSVGVIAIPYYERTNPALARVGRRAIAEVLADL